MNELHIMRREKNQHSNWHHRPISIHTHWEAHACAHEQRTSISTPPNRIKRKLQAIKFKPKMKQMQNELQLIAADTSHFSFIALAFSTIVFERNSIGK